MSAQGLGCSLIPGVVVKLSRTSLPGPGFSPKDLNSHAVKALLVSRALLVKIKRDLENQIRGLLKNPGLVIGRAKMNVFLPSALRSWPELAAAVAPLLNARAATDREFGANSTLLRDPTLARIGAVHGLFGGRRCLSLDHSQRYGHCYSRVRQCDARKGNAVALSLALT